MSQTRLTPEQIAQIETPEFKALVVKAAAKWPARRSAREREALDLAARIAEQTTPSDAPPDMSQTYPKAAGPVRIAAAACNDNLDSAVAELMNLLGITDGGIASLVFNAEDESAWVDMSAEDRFKALRRWLDIEESFREREEGNS